MRVRPTILMLIAQFGLAASVLAHAQLVRSVPSKNAALRVSPDAVELWFNELLDDRFNSVSIFPASDIGESKQTNLAQSQAVVDKQDRTHLIVKVGVLPPGEYVVEWRVLSRDGHSAPGRLLFKIEPD